MPDTENANGTAAAATATCLRLIDTRSPFQMGVWVTQLGARGCIDMRLRRVGANNHGRPAP
ncbi:hypothetical protein GCM10010309_15290 [Streptomyces violaceochromogenes]|nr:hypothetical protein GCM10010309_15290 [Streptomyces violaceochromogenes]